MRPKLYYVGREIGWDWAGQYAAGTRQERRSIRRKLARMADHYSAFVEGIWDGFADRAEQRAEAIQEGRTKRTINPHKLRRVLERVG